MKRILSLFIAYFVFISQAFAVVNVPDSRHWVAAGYGGGGTFSMIVPDHFTEGKAYLVSDVGSPMVTTDRGENWTWLSYSSTNGYNLTLGAALVQSKNNANLMYMIGGGEVWQRRILKSTDGGQNWVSSSTAYGASRPSSGRVLAFDPTDDDIVYVGSSNGTLARTTDGGVTWTNLATGVFGSTNIIRWIYVNPTGTKVFMGNKQYSGGGYGVKVYDVATGVITSIPIEPTTVSSYAVYKNNSSDFGTFIDGSSVENLCVTAGIQIACTADDGATWTYTADATSPATFSGNARYINRFAVKRLASGQLRFVVHTLLNAQDGTASGSFGRVSSNSGATWTTFTMSRNYTDNPTFFGVDSIMPESIREDQFDEDVFYFATNNSHFRSDNGGSTFVEKVKGAQQVVANEIKISPNGTLIVCHMDMGCQKSTNNGTTWTNMLPKFPWSESGIPYPGGHYWKIVLTGTFDDWEAGNGHIIVTSNYWYDRKPRIHRSIDNGATWATITTGLPTDALFGDCVWGSSGCYFRGLSVSPLNENIIYGVMDGAAYPNPATGDGGLFKSIDNGVTWSRVWTQPNNVYNALAVDPTDITANKLILGTAKSAFSPNGAGSYHKTQVSESAELTGSGQTRTGALNTLSNTIIPKYTTFTSSGGEIFTDAATSGVLVSNLGGSGTINYSTRAYSLTFVSAPSSTTVSYGVIGWVGDQFGPSNSTYDAVYDSAGHPYLGGGYGGAVIYKSVTTDFGDGTGSYGTWRLMHRFFNDSSTLTDGLLVDPQNNNRLFATIQNSLMPSTTNGNRVFVTNNASAHDQSNWYDITGDLPSEYGCQSLAINPTEGTRGFLYCATPGNGVFKLDLQDSISSSSPGRTIIGGSPLR